MTVLEAQGVEWEVDLPFAGRPDLCAGIIDRLVLLPAPQTSQIIFSPWGRGRRRRTRRY
jgi:hypothetical protein